MKHAPANEEKGGFRLDPTKKPKQIDLSDQDTVHYFVKREKK